METAGAERSHFLQAVLGSDLKRELISWKRAQEGEKNVVIFFERKKDAEHNA